MQPRHTAIDHLVDCNGPNLLRHREHYDSGLSGVQRRLKQRRQGNGCAAFVQPRCCAKPLTCKLRAPTSLDFLNYLIRNDDSCEKVAKDLEVISCDQREHRPRVVMTRSLVAGMLDVVREFLRGQIYHGDAVLSQAHEESGPIDAGQQRRLSGREALHLKQLHRHG